MKKLLIILLIGFLTPATKTSEMLNQPLIHYGAKVALLIGSGISGWYAGEAIAKYLLKQGIPENHTWTYFWKDTTNKKDIIAQLKNDDVFARMPFSVRHNILDEVYKIDFHNLIKKNDDAITQVVNLLSGALQDHISIISGCNTYRMLTCEYSVFHSALQKKITINIRRLT